jgi:hypothetical protein
VTEDLVDVFYKPLVQPLGNLVILCAQAEASLLRLIAALQGSDERAAQNLLKQKDVKEELLALARDRSGLEGFELSELLEGIANYWADRERRNRYYHDDWFVVLEEGGIPATRGLPLKKGSDIVFDDPTPGAIWGLAARFREHEHLFSHITWRIERSAESPR